MDQQAPLKINVIVSRDKKDLRCIELRRTLKQYDLIKLIVSAAFNNKPLVIVPQFSNQVRALQALQEKGIIYFDEQERLFKFFE